MRSFRLRRSLSTASAIPGYCTLIATSRPSFVVARCTCPMEAAAIASGSMSAMTLPARSPHSWAMSFSRRGKSTRGALSRSSARRVLIRSASSGSRPGRSTVLRTCPSFIAAPFICPSWTTTCSTTAAVRLRWARAFASSVRTRSTARPPATRAPCPATSPPIRAVRLKREVGVRSFVSSAIYEGLRATEPERWLRRG